MNLRCQSVTSAVLKSTGDTTNLNPTYRRHMTSEIPPGNESTRFREQQRDSFFFFSIMIDRAYNIVIKQGRLSLVRLQSQ